MPKIPVTYLELPSKDTAASKQFYGSAFGWTFEDFGDDYATFHDAGIEGGFNATVEGPIEHPLPVLQTEDIEAAFAAVTAAGGTIKVPIFPFPGGRRFHFLDPAGNELAVMQSDEAA